MRHVIFDCETNGLLEDVHTVHSLVLRDLESNAVVSCADRPGYTPIVVGLDMLRAAERLFAHNGIKYDYPVLRKIYPSWDVETDKIKDTFVIAQMVWAHIAKEDWSNAARGQFPKHLAGSHSLEAWGRRLGVHKGEYTDWCKEQGLDPWAQWRPEMQTYCEGDTDTCRALVQAIRKSGASAESIDTEHRLAWYLAAQERNGVPFDVEKATALHATLSARRQTLSTQLVTAVGPRLKRDGKPFTPKKDNEKKGVVAGAAYSKLKLHDFNPGSRDDIGTLLQVKYGWKPTEFGQDGKATVDDVVLEGFGTDIPEVTLIKEYLTLEKRLGQLAEGKQAWFRHMTTASPAAKQTGMVMIHGRVKQNHAITHRAAHSNPNLGQVPAVGNPYGAECRELFCVPKGWVMVGADASGLEARNLGHYMARYDGGAYAELLLKGDVHTANRIALGLPEGKEYRQRAKTWFYAFMYGGGDEKLGTILSPGLTKDERKTLGKKKKNAFLKSTPAMKRLIDAVQQKGRTQGYLDLIDGRRTYIRSDHSALNTLLQSAGAIICKRWIVEFDKRLTEEFGPQGWDGQWASLLWIHDEVELAVRPEIAERVCTILVEEIEKLTAHYHWRVPLTGEAKIGHTWRDVH